MAPLCGAKVLPFLTWFTCTGFVTPTDVVGETQARTIRQACSTSPQSRRLPQAACSSPLLGIASIVAALASSEWSPHLHHVDAHLSQPLWPSAWVCLACFHLVQQLEEGKTSPCGLGPCPPRCCREDVCHLVLV